MDGSTRLQRILSASLTGIISFSLAIALGGCAGSSESGIKGLSASDADKLNAPRNPFEKSEDPPMTAETRFAAGRLAEAQGAFGPALAQYQEALKINPNNEPALYRTGVIQTQLKAYPQGIETWKQYVTVTNGSALAYSNLAFCYDLAAKPVEAEAAYRQGLEKDPTCKPCHANYGLMLARLDRKQEALAQLQQAMTPAEAHYDLGSVLEQMGHNDNAQAEYRTALQLNPKFDEARTRLARLN